MSECDLEQFHSVATPLLPDAAFETGAHNAHPHTAYQPGLTIGKTASSSSGESK